MRSYLSRTMHHALFHLFVYTPVERHTLESTSTFRTMRVGRLLNRRELHVEK